MPSVADSATNSPKERLGNVPGFPAIHARRGEPFRQDNQTARPTLAGFTELFGLYLSGPVSLIPQLHSDPLVKVAVQVFILGMVDFVCQVADAERDDLVSMYEETLSEYDLLPDIPTEEFMLLTARTLPDEDDLTSLMSLAARSIHQFIADRDANAPTDLFNAVVIAEKNPKAFAGLAAVSNKNSTRAYYVHEILVVYTWIHNDVFKPSIRRLIPIPGFYDDVDFSEHRNALDELSGNLEDIIRKTIDSDEFASTIRDYATALLRTIRTLQDICDKLYQRSKGNSEAYSKRQYTEDLRSYQAHVREYKSLGDRMNRYL